MTVAAGSSDLQALAQGMIFSDGGLDAAFAVGIYSAYFIGSIPFGLLLTRLCGYGDIRKTGSGNIGATNVLRTGNKKLALATLLLDSVKGSLPILFVSAVVCALPSHCVDYVTDSGRNNAPGECAYSAHCLDYVIENKEVLLFMGLLAILGHCFPIWLKFKGGKGVATALGVLLVAVPHAGLSACATWLLMALIFKYSSLAALAAVAVAPVVTLLVYGAHPAGVCALIALLVWARHAANIKRLLKGEEPKIGAKKMEAANHHEDAQTPSEL